MGSPFSVFPRRFSGGVHPNNLRLLDADGIWRPGRLPEGPVPAEIIERIGLQRTSLVPEARFRVRRFFARAPRTLPPQALPTDRIALLVAVHRLRRDTLRAELCGEPRLAKAGFDALRMAYRTLVPLMPEGEQRRTTLVAEANCLWYFLGAHDSVLHTLEEAMATSAGDQRAQRAPIHSLFGDALLERRHWTLAAERYREASATWVEAFDRTGVGWSLLNRKRQAIEQARSTWLARYDIAELPSGESSPLDHLRRLLRTHDDTKYLVVDIQGQLHARLFPSHTQHPDAQFGDDEHVVAAGYIDAFRRHSTDPITLTIDRASASFRERTTADNLETARIHFQSFFPAALVMADPSRPAPHW